MRTARAILNFIAQEFFTATTMLVGLFATPLLIRWLGAECFGAFETCIDWCGYIALPFSGIAVALAPMLAASLARNERQRMASVLAAGVRAYCTVAVITLPLAVLLIIAIPRLVPVTSAARTDLRIGCALALIGVVLAPLGPFETLIQAEQRGYVVSVLATGRSLSITGASLALAWRGFKIAGQAAAMVGGLAIYQSFMVADVVRRDRGLIRSAISNRNDKGVRRELRNLNWSNFVWTLCGRVSLLTDNIVIALVLSPASVVPFFVTRQLAALAQGELQSIGNASWAGLAELRAQGQHASFNCRIVELTRIVTILGITTIVPIAAYNRTFVTLWVGGAHYGGPMLTFAAAASAFAMAIFSSWGWVFGATGAIAQIVPAMVVQTALNLALSVGLTFRLGVAGPALGTAIAIPAVSMWYCALMMRRSFGVSLRALTGAITAPLMLGIPYATMVGWWAVRMGEMGWIAMAAQMAAWATAFLAIAWIALLDRRERNAWIGRIQATLRIRGTA
jgi:O-antigen/teichoic acid export membrane protein